MWNSIASIFATEVRADNGAQLAWLIDPGNRAAEIYRPNGGVKVLANAGFLTGEGPVEGFTLDLLPVWDPLWHPFDSVGRQVPSFMECGASVR